MTPFKCWGCDHYNHGEGNSRCLGCFDSMMPSELSIWNIKPDFYEPDVVCDIAGAFDTSVSARLKCLTDREATMLLQYTLLQMKQVDIAEYHSIDRSIVSKTLTIAREKARKS